MVEPDILTGVSCPDSEGLWEVWGKTESWFPIQPPKKLVNLFRQGEKVKISNFNGLFFPKGKFVELQTLTGVDTEMLWEVWGKTEWYFQLSLLKTSKIYLEWATRSKFLTLLLIFF